ncbi:MAG: ABC transporter ATP-binding protein [Firmicutes bacterium]|nr:ABC transporter ATP-binding protein [Bacillota bacterium]
MDNAVISIDNMWKSYADVKALRGISLEIPKGEVFGIVGPDGAGKTTLIRILAGVLHYDSGQAHMMGKSLKEDLDTIRNDIGYISQRFSLYGDLTVEENIDFFMDIYPRHKDAKAKKKELLDFIGLAPFTDRLTSNLSGGMKQKLALLCSLIHDPKLLLMDEPTTGVDPVSRREFWSTVFNLQKQGLTVLASTPYMDEAEQFDRVALINKGEFIRIGTVDQIRESISGEVIEVMCSQPVKARDVLKETRGINDVELFGDKIHVFVDTANESITSTIKSKLKESGLDSGEILKVPYSIEDVFLKISSSGGLNGEGGKS